MLCHELHDLDEGVTAIGHIGIKASFFLPKLADSGPLLGAQFGQSPIDIFLVLLPKTVAFGQVHCINLPPEALHRGNSVPLPDQGGDWKTVGASSAEPQSGASAMTLALISSNCRLSRTKSLRNAASIHPLSV